MMKKSKLIVKNIFFFLITIFLTVSCNYNPKAGLNEETATRGNIKIGVDE